MKFNYSIRTQFSFLVKDRVLSCLLAGIARRRVNITALTVNKQNGGNLVRFVAGSSTAESTRDLRAVRNVLRSLGVTFREVKVVQVKNISPNVPGVYSSIFGALWCRVRVKAIYEGEQNATFLYVSDVQRTIRLLSQNHVRQCPGNCRRCG